MPDSVVAQAFIFGLISAASLPLGAVAALMWTPRPRLVAALMAFGGGALLAALTIDLVGEALRQRAFYSMALGALGGCALFVGLNRVVNDHGGFLRKAATTVRYLTTLKSAHVRSLADRLSLVPLFRELPPEAIADLLPQVQERVYYAGTTIIRQGEPGDSFFVIERGQVDVIDEKGGGRKFTTLDAHDVFGEMALLTGEPRSATAVAATETQVWVILKEQFDRLLASSPALAEVVATLAAQRGAVVDRDTTVDAGKAAVWAQAATEDLDARISAPSVTEVKEAARAHGGAPLAIWLGILLDGIPESLVVGASLLNASISVSLLAGLFLSNFPEALSSSVGMRHQGYRPARIVIMWGSLMLFTGLGAAFGSAVFAKVPHRVFAVMEGLAAGAMLTMIAETMLPEASNKGGAVTGVCTLLGFLAAIFFKTFE